MNNDVQIAVSTVADNQVIALGEDVSIITPPPESVSVVAATAVSMGGTSSVGALDDLSDVDTSTVTPTNGQVLTWDQTAGQWTPAGIPPASLSTLDGIGNVDTATVPKQAGEALVWNGSKWVNSSTKLAYTLTEGIDVHYGSTVLQLNFDHPNATPSSGIIDDSPLGKTFTGDGMITTTNPRAGIGALSGQLIIANAGSAIDPATNGAYTIEMWVRDWSTGVGNNELLNYANGGFGGGFRVGVTLSGAVNFRAGTSSAVTHPTTITRGVWNHIAITRQSGSSAQWRIHVNGVASPVNTTGWTLSSSQGLIIGNFSTIIDLLRVTKGVARYGAATFTPPSSIYAKGNGYNPSTINTFDDVDTSTAAPTDGQALVWDQAAGKWEPGSVATTAQGALADTALQPTSSIDALADVDTSTTAPTDGQVLAWDQAAGRWEPAAVPTPTPGSIDTLSDVDTDREHAAPLADGRALIYVNGKWQAGPVIGGYSYSTGNDALAANVVYGNSFNTGILDESGYWNQVDKVLIATTTGSPSVSTADKKYGTGSLLLAWGDYITFSSTTNSAAFNLGTGDFCFEGWFKDNRGYGARALFYIGNISTIINASNFIDVGDGNTWSIASSVAWPGGWVHVALTRQGNTFRLFQNGVNVGSATASTSYSSTFRIGYGNPASPYYWQGYIDDIRYTIGAARYTASFSAPSGAILGEQITSAYSINNLSDVDTVAAAPTSGQVLSWNGTNWVPRTSVLSTVTGITGATPITNCVAISQADYDAIATPDPNTLYVIV